MKKYQSYILSATAIACVVGYSVMLQPANHAGFSLPRPPVLSGIPFFAWPGSDTPNALKTKPVQLLPTGLPATYLDGIDADKAFEKEEVLGQTTLHNARSLQALFADSWNDSDMHLTLVARFLDKHFANKTKSMQFFDFYKRYYEAEHQRDIIWATNNSHLEKLKQTRNMLKTRFTREQYQKIYARDINIQIVDLELQPILDSSEPTQVKIDKVKAFLAAEIEMDLEQKEAQANYTIQFRILLPEQVALEKRHNIL